MAKNRKIRDALLLGIPNDNDGALSPKESLARLIAARDEVTKQSNNFLLASLGFSLIYSLKVLGLRLDLAILDYKIFETPYGMFVFCVGSSLAFIVAMSRFMDARVFDRYAKVTCERFWPGEAEYAYNTYPRVNSWLEPTARILSNLRSSRRVGFFVNSIIQVSGLILFVFYCSSIAAALHFLINFKWLADSIGQTFQFWLVVAFAVADALFLVATFVVLEIDVD